MPANSRWDLIRGLKGLKSVQYEKQLVGQTILSFLLFFNIFLQGSYLIIQQRVWQ